jgi:hypothetical protein
VRQPNPVVPGQFGTLVVGTADRVGFASVDGSVTASIIGTGRLIVSSGPSTLNINATREDSQVTGNLNSDPLFLGLPTFEYLLRASSPLVDRGLANLLSPNGSSTDLGGDPRVVDGNGDGTATRDVGAFE